VRVQVTGLELKDYKCLSVEEDFLNLAFGERLGKRNY